MSSGRTPPPLPAALRPLQQQRRFIHWRWQQRNGQWSKPPVSPSGDYIDALDRKNWLSFEQAIDALEHGPTEGGIDGIGFVLIDSGIGALDLDHCRTARGHINIISLWAHQQIKRVGSYTEITPSGEGLRIIGHAAGGEVHTSWKMHGGGKLEVFRNTRRYITISGAAINKQPLCNIDDLINELVAEHAVKSRRSSTPRTVAVPNLKINEHLPSGLNGDWRPIARRYRVPLDRVTDPVGDGRRSSVVFRIAMGMFERGASTDEVAAVVWASRAFQDKRGANRQALRAEVERIFAKAAANL
jgi:hypothetical protein